MIDSQENIDMNISEKEEQIIISGLKQYGRRAYQETKSKGLPITRLKGNRILEINSDSTSIVGEVPQTKFKITQRSFNLDV